MSFGELLADLDATVFAHLSDDTAAVWHRAAGPTYTVAAMVEGGEKQAAPGGLPSFSSGTVIRLSAAELIAKVPDLSGLTQEQIEQIAPEYAEAFPPPPRHPVAGEQIVVLGKRYIFHGEPWLDDASDSRDWLCPATAA